MALIEYAPTKHCRAVVLKFICTVASAQRPYLTMSKTPFNEPDLTVNYAAIVASPIFISCTSSSVSNASTHIVNISFFF